MTNNYLSEQVTVLQTQLDAARNEIVLLKGASIIAPAPASRSSSNVGR